MLGVEAPDRTPPEIAVSDTAAAIIANALQANPGQRGAPLHRRALAALVSTSVRWRGTRFRAESNGVALLFDVASAQKAKGLSIDVEETVQGTAFKIDNPNAPPSVGPDVAVRACPPRGAKRPPLPPSWTYAPPTSGDGAGGHRGLDPARRRRHEDRVGACEGYEARLLLPHRGSAAGPRPSTSVRRGSPTCTTSKAASTHGRGRWTPRYRGTEFDIEGRPGVEGTAAAALIAHRFSTRHGPPRALPVSGRRRASGARPGRSIPALPGEARRPGRW